MKKILITSALPYVNNVPHLGNIIGCVLSADVFARYCRSKGYETLYICGTDEYGTATEAKALEEGITPKEICDKYHKIHKEIYQWFGISSDIFGRTSTERHSELVQNIFLDLYKNDMIVKTEVEQPFDEKVGMFLADRFVIGTCPFCKSENARSDQCDKCSKLLTYGELINPRSKLSGTTPILKKTSHLMLNLEKIQPKLEKWIDEVESKSLWSANTISIARSWLNEGLKARSITRDLKWGVPVPLPGWENKVFYVWFDAPIGYISITASLIGEKYKQWWNGNEDTHHYEFIGKDNVPFHAIIFPATLIGTEKKWTLPHYISSTEFLNYEDGKFSKSKGIGVFGNDAMDSGIPADVWRYYLLANRPESSDTTFSWDDFGKKSNNELLANYGNLVNRALVFIEKNFEGIIPEAKFTPEDSEFLSSQRIRLEKVSELMEAVKIRQAVSEFMSAASATNAYFQSNEPWKLVSGGNKERAGTVMNVLANQIYDLAIAGEPFLPFTSMEIFVQLNVENKNWDEIGKLKITGGHKIGKPSHLFTPIEKKKLDELKMKFSGKQNKPVSEKSSTTKTTAEKPPVQKIDVSEIEFEVGIIEEVKKHPNADKLFVEKILMKDGEVRQVCSGLAGKFTEEELLSKTCVIVKNLKPAVLRGVESNGMLLVAQGENGMELLSPNVVAGTPVQFEGFKRNEKFRQISIDEFFTVKLEAKNGEIFADGKRMYVDMEPVSLEKVKDGKVS